MSSRALVITADDFGLSRPVNEAIEIAHREGVLSAASLMVAEPGTGDAVRLARAMPTLAVGLHVTLTDGHPVLAPGRIPDLVGADGRFRTDMVRLGASIFFRPAVQRQVAAEIEAQFEAFRATGLPLDHVNAHRHTHINPAIGRLIVTIGRRFGMRGLRAPVEPAIVLDAIESGPGRLEARIAAPLARLLAAGARRAGLVVPDQVFGLRWSGAMTTARLAGLIRGLPPGRSEIYLHPATADAFPGSAEGYRYRDELAALTSPEAKAALAEAGLKPGGYSGF